MTKRKPEKVIVHRIELQTKERDLVETIKKKYGVGTLDLDKGVFIPSN